MIYLKYNSKMLVTQKGQATIILAITLVVFLAFCGCAIDEACIYLAKSRLQSAVDAGGISALTNLVNLLRDSEHGIMNGDIRDQIQDAAVEMVNYNLKSQGLVGGTVTARVTVDGRGEGGKKKVDRNIVIEVTAKDFKAPTLFIGMLLPGNRLVIVSASSIARRAPVMVCLALDISTSMRWTTFGHADNKLEEMKKRAKEIMDSLIVNLDQVSLVTFNDTAIVFRGNRDLGGGMRLLTKPYKQDVFNRIDDIRTAIGSSNLAEGIEAGRNQIKRLVDDDPESAKDAFKTVILMTDGDATVLRGLFQNPTGILPPTTPGIYEYYADTEGHQMENVVCDVRIDPDCQDIKKWLNDFSYLDSGDPPQKQGTDAVGNPIPSDLALDPGFELKKEALDLAIVEAEYTKNSRNGADPNDKGITIYTVGFGDTPNPRDPADPYENINYSPNVLIGDRGGIKQYLLRKIANVRPNGDPQFETGSYSNVTGGYNDDQSEGLYIPNPQTQDELLPLISRIQQAAKIRLVE